jgi:hypothetical protein
MPVPAHGALLAAHSAAVVDGFDASEWGTVLLEYDASYTSTITDAGGGAVSAWAPKSGSVGATLAQGTAANRPITGTRTQNGLNVLDFDGTNDLLSVDIADEAQPLTIALVCFTDDGTLSNRQPIGTGSPSQPCFLTTVTSWRYHAGTTQTSSVNSSTTPMVILIGQFNGASSAFWVNGAQRTAMNPGAFGTHTVSVGGQFPGSNFWNGWIGHIIYYDGTVSDLAGLDGALNEKWAIY